MASPHEALRIDYDQHNDVLRVLTTPEPVPSIAVPGTGVTILVSEKQDQIVGMVFEHYLPMIRRSLPENLQKIPEDALVQVSMGVIENCVPPMLSSCAPAVKDQIAQWLEAVDSHYR